VYRAAPSRGYLWLALLGVLPAIPVFFAAMSFTRIPWFAALVALPGLLIAGPFLFLAALYPTMRYTVGESALSITYGPVLHYVVPYAEIRSVERRDLDPSIRSSVRVPGLALFRVAYVDAGIVRMCATRAAERVLLVRTDDDQYGITPADEPRFVADLRARLGWAG
jgi:hypothetical protein